MAKNRSREVVVMGLDPSGKFAVSFSPIGA